MPVDTRFASDLKTRPSLSWIGDEKDVWHDLKTQRLPRWIRVTTATPSPPIFPLVDPKDLQLGSTIASLLGVEATVKRREDSGILELRTLRPPTLTPDGFPDDARRALIQTAEAEDRRAFPRVRQSASDVILAEFRSSIRGEPNLDVIGPGGRVTVYAGPGWVEADVVVRKRLSGIPSRWRSLNDLVESINTRISERVSRLDNVRMFAALGYFELSKYERQAWLRPAFVFLLENTLSEDPSVVWQETLVEAATTITQISVQDGLGSWD